MTFLSVGTGTVDSVELICVVQSVITIRGRRQYLILNARARKNNPLEYPRENNNLYTAWE